MGRAGSTDARACAALRAIWANWYEGAPLEFVGEYYRHTLMTPAFTPEDKEYGAPKVVLAAVGPKMTEVAGEVADGMIIHPFSTLPYINANLASHRARFGKGR